MCFALAHKTRPDPRVHSSPILWAGVKLYSPNKNEKELGVASVGLNSFTGSDLDILPITTAADSVAGKLLSLVSYQFQSGVLYQAGETLDIAGVIYDIRSSDIANTLSVTLQAGK